MKNKGDIQRKRLISKFLDGRKIFVQKFDLVLGEHDMIRNRLKNFSKKIRKKFLELLKFYEINMKFFKFSGFFEVTLNSWNSLRSWIRLKFCQKFVSGE